MCSELMNTMKALWRETIYCFPGFRSSGELVGAENLIERFAKWRKDDLPIVPPKWVINQRDKFRQFEGAAGLSRRNDVKRWSMHVMWTRS
jgi:hypothetical protein